MSKSILITGSTDGIGKLAAIKIAQAGHHVLLHGRNKEKLNSCVQEIRSLSGNDAVDGVLSDLSDLKNLSHCAKEIESKVQQLDVLINNAGVYLSASAKNNMGFDMRFAVNYFAPYHLTQLLLPLIQKSSNPRIINLGSAAQDSVSLDVLSGNKNISPQSAYAQSKLALTMWSFYLAKKLPNVTVIPVNPGSLLNTKMVQEAFGKFWSSADKGGQVLYELALNEKYKSDSGKYFDNDLGDPMGTFGPAHPEASDENKIAALIASTDKILASIN